MTDTQMLDWLDEQGICEVLLSDGTEIYIEGPIRKAIIQACDNKNERDGMRYYESLRG